MSNNPKLVVVYYGRFQPPHQGHIGVYNHLVSKFGKSNVYIGTSNKVDPEKSPLTFQWKKKIFKSLNVPVNKLIQTKMNYNAKEIQQSLSLDADNTVFIVALGEKDATRLGGKYFQPYTKGRELEPMIDAAYYYTIPNIKSDGKILSATDVRTILRKDELDKTDYAKLKNMLGMSRAGIDNLKPLFEHYVEMDEISILNELIALDKNKCDQKDHP